VALTRFQRTRNAGRNAELYSSTAVAKQNKAGTIGRFPSHQTRTAPLSKTAISKMPNQGDVTRVLSPSFFAGRYLIEIQGWDWNLHIGMSSEATPQDNRLLSLPYHPSEPSFLGGRPLAIRITRRLGGLASRSPDRSDAVADG
jgi:hypothetical protein